MIWLAVGTNTISKVSHVVIVPAGANGSLVAGLIGGGVVLLGVFLADLLTRWRDRRSRLEEATWGMLAASSTLMTGSVGHLTEHELIARYAELMQGLNRIRTHASWPTPNAEQIRAEVDEIYARFFVALDKWTSGEEGPPRLGPIIGEQLSGLVFPGKPTVRQRINEALTGEGRPTIEQRDPEAKHNAPKTQTVDHSAGAVSPE